MNYIYDILLNFHPEYYEFYDWNTSDKITHIRKIPLFRISREQLEDIKNKKIKIEDQFLNIINYKTEKFKRNEILKIKYAAIFSDTKEAIAVMLNKYGLIFMKSSLTIDENEDAVDNAKFQRETTINYNIIEDKKHDNFKTRFEIENKKFIENELEKIYKDKNQKKLSYICLECFGNQEPNIDKAFNKLKKEINKFNENFHKIFNFFQLTKQK